MNTLSCIKWRNIAHNLQNLSTSQILHCLAIYNEYTLRNSIAELKHFKIYHNGCILLPINSQYGYNKGTNLQDKGSKQEVRLSCTQLIHLNNLIEETEVRYNRSQQVNHRSYRYILRLKLCSLEGVRNMFYEYAYAKADELEKMQLDLYNKTGIAWSDALAEESDAEEDEDSTTDAE